MRTTNLAAALLIAMAGFPATAQSQTADATVDYAAFAQLTAELADYRAARLISRDEFLRRSSGNDALILDTRSAEAFAAGHLKGAVNLPFSDFTDEKLRQIIGTDLSRPIFIYCNNNFSDDEFPVMLKRAPLALNIPTFINLYGYGYKNIWELDGTTTLSAVEWIAPD